MMNKIYYSLLFSFLFLGHANAQRWVQMLEDPTVNFYDVKSAFNQEWGNRPYIRGRGWKQYKRWEYFMESRTFPHGKRPRPAQAWEEYLKFKSKYETKPTFASRAANWMPLGPMTWTNTTGYNPGNGRINCIAEDPTNAGIIYAGAPSGGLWKSINGGTSWNCLTDDLPILGVSAILIDSLNPSIIYIGTGDGDGADTYSIGILKSTDGGASWSNTGLNWTTGNNRLIRRLIMHPTNNQIILAATNDGIYKTNDGGQNWTQSQTGNMRDVEFKPGDPSIVYACSDQFFKSINGGNSFTLVNTGLPAGTLVNRASIAVTAANSNYVYILYGDENDSGFYGLYRSVNSGNSFSLQSNSPNIFTYEEDGSGVGGQSWYDMALAVSPFNAEEVYSGGINVWKSMDGGVTWTCNTHWVYPAALGYVHADIHTLDFFGNRLYCGSDGGLFISNNFANSWSDISAGMEIMQFYRFGAGTQNAYQIIGGAQDNGTNYLNNGGWSHVLGADGMEAIIDYSNSQIMYGEYQSGGLSRSTDGGQNWTYIAPTTAGDASWVMPYTLDPNIPTTIYAAYEEVVKSTDRGDNWINISNFGTGNSLNYIAVAKSNTNYIYTGTNNVLYKTVDGGLNWTTITPTISAAIRYIVIDPLNEQRIWICLSGFNATQKVFYSPDAGQSWQNISGNLPNLPVNCIEYQNGTTDGLYVGTDVGIFYKDNNLSNWQSYMTGLPNVQVSELEIHYGINKIRAATYGRGVWESDLFTPSLIPPQAAFSNLNTTICSGDSVQFIDQSVNAAPGWQWFFQGGSPAISTAQNPVISYTQAGNYQVTLVVNNPNGSDTIVQNVNIDFPPNTVTVDLSFDSYPEESSWNITDTLGNIVASGGPYSGATGNMTETVCLPDGCYSFNMLDSYGDGMCCSYGNGSYAVTDSTGTILANGGQFTNSETTTICFNSTPPLSIDQTSRTQSNCGANNGTITVTASGGTSPYQYSIDGNNYQNNNIISSLSPGNYTVYVRDASFRIDSAFVTITEYPGPIAVANSSNPNVLLSNGANVNFSGILSSNVGSFFWDFGDGSTANSMTTSHSYTAVGVYTVIMTATTDSCTATDTIIVTVNQASSLSQNTVNKLNVEVMPNPFQTYFIVQVALPEIENDLEIFIHNGLGRLVYYEKANGNIQNFSKQINFGNESAGIYYLSVQTEKYRQFKKFVKSE